MRSLFLVAAAVAQFIAAAPVLAAEPYIAFDRFGEKAIDPARWADTERSRVIKGGALHLMQRSWGLAGADIGVTSANWSSNLTNPAAISQLRARVTVTGLETNACLTNPAIADARARIIGGFFNTDLLGAMTPGNMMGDAVAQVRLIRSSNSSDPAGVLRVQGLLNICTTADCAGAFTVGNVVDLGTISTGSAATVQLQWDKAAKTFYFSRDNTHAGTVAYPYSDSTPPGVLFRQLSTRVNLPNCQSAPRVGGMVDARFDDVSVNQSALP